MNYPFTKRPCAPSKPKKHAPVPDEFETRSYCVFRNDKNQIILKIEEEADKYNKEEELYQYEVDNLEKVTRLTFLSVLAIKTLINETISPEVNDFEIEEMHDRDGYIECIEVSFRVKKDENKYKKEVDRHNNRFEQYSRQYEKYQAELQAFNEQKKKERIDRLQKQIKTLTNEQSS